MLRDFLRDFKLGARKKAVILGKGPSFEKLLEADSYRYPVSEWVWCGINQAIKRVPCEVGIAAHIEPIEECRDELDGLGAVVVPYFPLYGWNTEHDKSWRDYKILDRSNVYCYNPNWCSNRVKDSQVIQSFGTTAHHIVEMLAILGVREFVFYGIDGGMKAYGKKYYADGFNHDPKYYFEQNKIPADFDAFWRPYFQYRRRYGLRYTFV